MSQNNPQNQDATQPGTDKVVLITGASSGIGEAAARLLARQGARVVLGARRTERLESLAADIRAEGGTAEVFGVDVRDRAGVQAFADFALEKFGRIDVLFNNAGIMPLSPLNALLVDQWDEMIDVNIRGVLHGIAAVLPVMERQGSGHIINTASVAAHWAGPTAAVYCGTKYAVWAISEALRQESQQVRVTILSPGVVSTELGHDIVHEGSQAFLKELRQNALTPDSVARAVWYAICQPDDVDVSEIIIRPIRESF